MRIHKRIWTLVVLGVIVSFIVVACGGDDEPTATQPAATTATQAAVATATSAPAASTATPVPTPTPNPTATLAPVVKPTRGGILKERLNADIRRGQSWDVHENGGVVAIRVGNALNNSVLMLDELKPTIIKNDLADTWDISGDGLTYTFNLNPNAVFHDGTPVTASDVIFSYNRIINNDVGNGRSHVRSILQPYIESLSAPDAQTLSIKLNFPSLAFLEGVASIFAAIYPERLGSEYWASVGNVPIGSGPFKFVERIADTRITVERNDAYFKTDEFGDPLPYLDGIEWEIVPDSALAYAAFRVGRFPIADYLDPSLLNTNIDQMRAEQPDYTYATGFGSWRYYGFRNKPPFDDVRIRTALDLLINKPAFSQIRYPGYGHSGVSPLLPPSLSGKWGLTDERVSELINTGPVTSARIAQAKALFADAGIDFDSFEFNLLTLGIPTYDDDAIVLKADWETAGIKVNLENDGGPAQFQPKRIAGDFDVYYVPASSLSPDPDFVLGPFYPTGREQNFGQFSDPTVDRLFDEQTRTIDAAKRKAILVELQEYILTEANWYPKIAWAGAWTAWAPQIRNYTSTCPGAYCHRSRHEITWIAVDES